TLDTTYAGTVHFTSTDTGNGVVLPADSKLSGGTGTFSATLVTAGSQTITAADTVDSSISGSARITGQPAPALQLQFGQQPTNTVAAAVIRPAVTVRVVDKYGNVISSDNTDQVSLIIGNNTGGGTLGGTTVVTVHNGVATFSDLTIDKPGNGYTL